MPAVSRECVSLLFNFIVQLASHIWILESLGWGGGREEGGCKGRGRGAAGGRRAMAPGPALELEAALWDLYLGWGQGAQVIGWVPLQRWGSPVSGFPAPVGEAGAGGRLVAGVFFSDLEK